MFDPLSAFRPEPWTEDAACRDLGAGGDAFFAAARGEQYTEARRVCARCPLDVKRQCLRFALGNNEQGFWAGTTQAQRRALAREQMAA